MPPNSPVSYQSTWHEIASSARMSENLAGLSINKSAAFGAMHSRDLTPRALYATVVILGKHDAHGGLFHRLCSQLPCEILRLICSYQYTPSPLYDEENASPGNQKDPSVPHAYKCFITDLPSELFRLVIAKALPAKGVVVRCRCGRRRVARDPKRKPQRTVASDLMTLCRVLKNEVMEVLYAERTFAIHVHQGFDDAGIEFLDAGRQPLHYMESSSDDRFVRFASNAEFGFRQLKKIEITIFPSQEDIRSKATAINTYYTNLALVRLLEREEGAKGKNRMTAITIIFAESTSTAQGHAGRRSILNGENYWWDPERSEARSTAIHNISDIEMLLRPFINITGVHNVRVELPTNVRHHQQTVGFVSDLIASMESQKGLPTIDEKFWLHDKMEALRHEVEAHIFDKEFGKKHRLQDSMDADEALDLDTMEDLDDDAPVFKDSFKSMADESKKRRKVARTKTGKGTSEVDSDSSDSDGDPALLFSKRKGKGTATKWDMRRLLYEDIGGARPSGQKLGGSSLPNTNSITGRLRADREKLVSSRARAPKLFSPKSPLGGVSAGADETVALARPQMGSEGTDMDAGPCMPHEGLKFTTAISAANVLNPRRKSGNSIMFFDFEDKMEKQSVKLEDPGLKVLANDGRADIDAVSTASEHSTTDSLDTDDEEEVSDGSGQNQSFQTDRMAAQGGYRCRNHFGFRLS